MELVAVVGATGRQGLAQMRQLKAAGYNTRALSRSESPNFGNGAQPDEIRKFDLEDPATWSAAFDGCHAVFYTQPLISAQPRDQQIAPVAAAAQKANVQRFVWNTSMWIPERPGDPHSYGMNTAAINAIYRTGVPATIFGSVLFMDNLLTNWARPFIVNEGRYVYPHQPHLKANWISLDDVGKCMVASLGRPDFEGSWLNIGGPQRLKPQEVADTLSSVLEKNISYDPCTPEEFSNFLISAFEENRVPKEARDGFADYIKSFYEYNNSAPTKPFEVDFNFVQQRLPEVEFETLEQWASRQDWSDEAHRPPAG